MRSSMGTKHVRKDDQAMKERERVAVLIYVRSGIDIEVEHALPDEEFSIVQVHTVQEVSLMRQEGCRFQIALLPDSLAGAEWLELWSELTLCDRRPAIVVYSQNPTFQLWSGVLELGGVDAIAFPFNEQELREAVVAAHEHWRKSATGDDLAVQ